MNWETLLCIGDSITIGARSYIGFPEYLGHFLSKETNTEWNVINQAISGYTCRDISRNISSNFTNIKNQNPSIATILIGTNDVKTNTSPELFEIAYVQLITKVKLLIPGNNILLIKIPNFTKGIKYPYTFKLNEQIPQYNDIITRLSKKYQLRLIELSTEQEHLFDGVHLNECGSRCVAKQISSTILIDKGYENSTTQP